jgi:hypothetical protein
MTKRYFIVFIVFLILFSSACTKSDNSNNRDSSVVDENSEQDTIAEDVDELLEEIEEIEIKGNIIVPDNLNTITPDLWNQYEDANCSNEPFITICEYYYETKNETGDKSIKNLEWNSLCAYVKHYKGQNTWSTGSYDYETLGYEEGECFQGMYKE